MRAVRFRMTPTLLKDVLHLPSDTRIKAVALVETDGFQFVEVTVSHQDLLEVPPHEPPPLVTPAFDLAQSRVEFRGWGQG